MIPVRVEHRTSGFEPSDPYVRRFWVAAIGASAVAELLRLVRAAEKGEGVRLPRSLPLLLRVGLVRAESAGLIVFNRVPAVPRELRWRFPPSLGSEHSRWVLALDGENRHQEESDAFSNGEGQGNTQVGLASENQ